jgi:hypothetical protein
MRNRVKTSLLVAFAIALSIPSFGQSDITDLLKLYSDQTKNDISLIAKEYMKPFGEEFGKSLNTGWYTSAKPHKLGGFDITFSATVIPVSSSMKTIDLSSLNLNVLKYTQSTSPSVVGSDVNGSTVYLGTNSTSTSMQLPSGANIPVLPMGSYNIGVGLPFHTDVSFRFIPKISFGDNGKFGLWGFGIKNEFKEFIPVFSMLPFNVSAFFGLTKYDLSWDMNDNAYATGSAKHELATNSTSYTTRLLISKSIPILTVYGGLGYNSNASNYKLSGAYKVSTLTPTINDPFNLDYSSTGMMFNAGLRVKLAVFMLFGDYTYAGTSMYTAGFGFTFR